jgi:hypothetical protein
MDTATKLLLPLLLTGSCLGQGIAQSIPSGNVAPRTEPPAVQSAEGNGSEVVMGLRLSHDALVWILENNGGQPRLVPVIHHDTNIRNNVEANIARSAVWEKQKKDVVVAGSKAEIRLHPGDINLFVQYSKAEDNEISKSSPSAKVVYAILKLRPEDNLRVVGWYEFSRLSGSPKLSESLVESKQAPLANFEWLKVTPSQPLSPGEYALVQFVPGKNAIGGWVFDFGVDQ